MLWFSVDISIDRDGAVATMWKASRTTESRLISKQTEECMTRPLPRSLINTEPSRAFQRFCKRRIAGVEPSSLTGWYLRGSCDRGILYYLILLLFHVIQYMELVPLSSRLDLFLPSFHIKPHIPHFFQRFGFQPH